MQTTELFSVQLRTGWTLVAGKEHHRWAAGSESGPGKLSLAPQIQQDEVWAYQPKAVQKGWFSVD